jgi:hypothetical protein
MKKINRRNFMKSSVTGMAGFICNPFTDKRQGKNQKERKLIYRTLGKTGIRVPVIGMGILSSGSPALMRAALDAGITHFDSTAGQSQIHNEEMIPRFIFSRITKRVFILKQQRRMNFSRNLIWPLNV